MILQHTQSHYKNQFFLLQKIIFFQINPRETPIFPIKNTLGQFNLAYFLTLYHFKYTYLSD